MIGKQTLCPKGSETSVSVIYTLTKGTNLTVNKTQTPLLFKGSHTVARLHRVLKHATTRAHTHLCAKTSILLEHEEGTRRSVTRGSQWEQR